MSADTLDAAKSPGEMLRLAVMGELPWLLGGALATISGIILLIDDIKDFGKIGGNRPDFFRPGQMTNQPIHHWMIGLGAIIAGIVLMMVGMVKVIVTLQGRDNVTFLAIKEAYEQGLK